MDTKFSLFVNFLKTYGFLKTSPGSRPCGTMAARLPAGHDSALRVLAAAHWCEPERAVAGGQTIQELDRPE
jgi:hypothetical protein